MILTHEDIERQAEQFLGYYAKFKGEKLGNVFRFWADSKDFDKETKEAIRREVKRLLKEDNQ